MKFAAVCLVLFLVYIAKASDYDYADDHYYDDDYDSDNGLQRKRQMNIIVVNDYALRKRFFNGNNDRVEKMNKNVTKFVRRIFKQVNIGVNLDKMYYWWKPNKIVAADIDELAKKFAKNVAKELFEEYQ